jgi:hypothetical protein
MVSDPFYFIISQASDILNEFGRKAGRKKAIKMTNNGKAVLGSFNEGLARGDVRE